MVIFISMKVDQSMTANLKYAFFFCQTEFYLITRSMSIKKGIDITKKLLESCLILYKRTLDNLGDSLVGRRNAG